MQIFAAVWSDKSEVVSMYLKDLLADINFKCFICPTSYHSGKEREQVSMLRL